MFWGTEDRLGFSLFNDFLFETRDRRVDNLGADRETLGSDNDSGTLVSTPIQRDVHTVVPSSSDFFCLEAYPGEKPGSSTRFDVIILFNN